MKRVKIFDGEGKTRDERESCFPVKTDKNTGVCMQ